MFVRFTCIAACISSSSSLSNISLRGYSPVCLSVPSGGTFGLFPALGSCIKAAINTHEEVFVWLFCFVLFLSVVNTLEWDFCVTW